MVTNSEKPDEPSPRWAYLLLAGLILVILWGTLIALWQLPRHMPQLGEAVASPKPAETGMPARLSPTASPTPGPTHPSTSTSAIPSPTAGTLAITELAAEVDDRAGIITFHMAAEVLPLRQVDEVLLWYDTEVGHRMQRIAGPLPASTTLSYQIDASQEGLTATISTDGSSPLTTGEIDYWWLVRDTSGETARAGGMVALGPALQASVTTATPEPPVDFTWAMSESQHFQFHFVPGTAAERDLSHVGSLAEAALARTSAVLEVEFDDRMGIYLVPRVFWQGGATYGDKVQLMSYLDRNYADVETWAYFTHEGTHALAQDFIQPKQQDSGPDGVLVEGLAVWASNGHYDQEPVDAWAAVVANSEEYIPLAELREGPFYDFQHEVSYLEGASFVKFLIEQYGLDKLKELYGLATGEAEHDEALVKRLYGQGYDDLESSWLGYLSELEPTTDEANRWRLTRRAFDLMRRYQTELDPDARILPPLPPPEWTTDTLAIFLHRVGAPVNVALETALIAAGDRLDHGDLAGAAALLDDVESALNAGGVPERPGLKDRLAIIDLIAQQNRAILRADREAYLDTVDPDSLLAADRVIEERLRSPFTGYAQEIVRLDVAEDGQSAEGAVLLHAQLAGEGFGQDLTDGQLFAVAFAKSAGRWRMIHRESMVQTLSWPPSACETGEESVLQ